MVQFVPHTHKMPCSHIACCRCRCVCTTLCSTYGSQLQHLQGVGDYIDADSITHLARLTALTSLDLTTERHALPVAPRSLHVLSALPHLSHLQLGNHLACHDTCELAAALPALQDLEFTYVCEVHVSVQDFAPLKQSRSLQRLGVSGVACSDELLELLASNPGRVFERETLLERVWGYQYAGETRTVDVHIQRLRQRIEDDPHQPRYLVTVRNIGYKFER